MVEKYVGLRHIFDLRKTSYWAMLKERIEDNAGDTTFTAGNAQVQSDSSSREEGTLDIIKQFEMLKRKTNMTMKHT